MNKKIFILPLVAATGFFALTSCGNSGPNRSGNDLYVTVYDGGYGTEWISKVAKDYEALTGVKVHWEADQTILDRMDSELNNPESDIYMSHDIRWQEYADLGLLEELDDLYSSNDKIYGTNKTFKQRITQTADEISQVNGHYYKVCYTQGAGGFVYNVDMFEANHWTVPTTYEEFKTLCQTIVEADIKVGRNTVVPIAWSGADRQYYWDYIVYEWWAQLAGIDKINTFKSYMIQPGVYSTGYEVFNPSTYRKEFKQAYDLWHDLIAKNKSFSNSDAVDAKLFRANSLFASGLSAMIPYAQWAKHEIQENSGIQFNFDIAMMKTPKVSADAPDYNYNVGYGDSIIVPKNIPAESKALAKEFIKYLSSPEACKTFVDKANGAFLAFDYSDVDLGELLNDKYIKSVHEKLTQCQNFNLVSMNPIAIYNSSTLKPWISDVYYYSNAFKEPTSTANQGTAVCTNLYNTARSSWASWMQIAGVHD